MVRKEDSKKRADALKALLSVRREGKGKASLIRHRSKKKRLAEERHQERLNEPKERGAPSGSVGSKKDSSSTKPACGRVFLGRKSQRGKPLRDELEFGGHPHAGSPL